MTFGVAVIVLLMLSFGFSAVLTRVMMPVCKLWGFVARPREGRYHSEVISLGGGISIFLSLILVLVAGASGLLLSGGEDAEIFRKMVVYRQGFISRWVEFVFLIISMTGLFGLGLWDDMKHLDWPVKLVSQFVFAGMAVWLADVRVEFFIENMLVTGVFSAVWMVLVINMFNFLDNMDGLSTGMAAIISGILFFSAMMSGQVFVGGLAIVTLGILCGFLVYNFPPAKIFMGDAGSLVVGFLVAVLTLKTTYYQQTQSGGWYAVFMPAVALAVPLYDFISVTLIRLSQGRSPFVGDTQHFSHRLVRRGFTDKQVVMTLYLATLCTGLGAIVLRQVGPTGAVLIFVQTVMILSIVAILEASGNESEKE